MRPKIIHSIMPIEMQDRSTYQVSLRLPFANEKIERVKFHIWKNEKVQVFNMHFTVNDGEYACFETEADLRFCQFNYYFFSFEIGNRILYYRHMEGLYHWSIQDEEVFEFYQEALEACRSGNLPVGTYKILQISCEHLVFERYCGKNKVIIIANRSEHKLKIAIPRAYCNEQVIFCTEGSDCENLLPKGAIVLRK